MHLRTLLSKISAYSHCSNPVNQCTVLLFRTPTPLITSFIILAGNFSGLNRHERSYTNLSFMRSLQTRKRMNRIPILQEKEKSCNQPRQRFHTGLTSICISACIRSTLCIGTKDQDFQIHVLQDFGCKTENIHEYFCRGNPCSD